MIALINYSDFLFQLLAAWIIFSCACRHVCAFGIAVLCNYFLVVWAINQFNQFIEMKVTLIPAFNLFVRKKLIESSKYPGMRWVSKPLSSVAGTIGCMHATCTIAVDTAAWVFNATCLQLSYNCRIQYQYILHIVCRTLAVLVVDDVLHVFKCVLATPQPKVTYLKGTWPTLSDASLKHRIEDVGCWSWRHVRF